MSVVWPEKFTPQGLGQSTKLNLPGVSTRSALQIATVAPGVTVTRSRFLEAEGRCDHIKRQSDTMLVVIGLSGVTALCCPSSGQIAEIREGACWLVHPTALGVERRIEPGVATSSLVVTLRREEASVNLQAATEEFASSGRAFAEVPIVPQGVVALDTLFKKEFSGADLLQAEARCLGVIAEVFAAYGAGDALDLKSRVLNYLEPRLGSKVALDDVARHIGVNRTELNARLRRECGATVFELLRTLRLTQAKRLQAQGRSMAQIADETGFSSASHLCRALKAAP